MYQTIIIGGGPSGYGAGCIRTKSKCTLIRRKGSG